MVEVEQLSFHLKVCHCLLVVYRWVNPLGRLQVYLILKQRLAVPGGSEMEVMAEVSITISTIHGL